MHHHGGIGLLIPYDVHYGFAAKRHAEREAVLHKAFETMRERFVRGIPRPPASPTEAWIDKPRATNGSADELHVKFRPRVSQSR